MEAVTARPELNVVHQAHVLDFFPGLPDGCIQIVVTSEPYWGLRVYGTPPTVWPPPSALDGDRTWEVCEHEWANGGELAYAVDAGATSQRPGRSHQQGHVKSESALCSKCAAWRGHYGLEPTISLYVEHTVMWMRALRPKLRDDGTVWLNLGDSYASGKGTCYNPGGGGTSLGQARKGADAHPLDRGNASDLHDMGLKPKDLVMMPARVALALQADGWWVRCRVTWSKLNPMPESVDSRPTKSDEAIFICTKNAAKSIYWTHREGRGTRTKPPPDYRYSQASAQWGTLVYLNEQGEEPADWKTSIIACPVCDGKGRAPCYEMPSGLIEKPLLLGYRECECQRHEDDRAEDDLSEEDLAEREEEARMRPPLRKGQVYEWERTNLWTGHDYFYDADAVREPHKRASIERDRYAYNKAMQGRYFTPSERRSPERACARKKTAASPHAGGRRQAPEPGEPNALHPAGRNLRSVWHLPTKPTPGAHFATYPDKLVEPCILAGSSAQACPECGGPWERVVERSGVRPGDSARAPGSNPSNFGGVGTPGMGGGAPRQKWLDEHPLVTLGFRPTCSCEGNDGSGRCIVCDPFAGTATTGVVALRLGRDFLGCDLMGGDRDFGKGPGGVKHHTANDRLRAAEKSLSLRDYLEGQESLWEGG